MVTPHQLKHDTITGPSSVRAALEDNFDRLVEMLGDYPIEFKVPHLGYRWLWGCRDDIVKTLLELDEMIDGEMN